MDRALTNDGLPLNRSDEGAEPGDGRVEFVVAHMYEFDDIPHDIEYLRSGNETGIISP